MCKKCNLDLVEQVEMKVMDTRMVDDDNKETEKLRKQKE